MDDLVRQGQWWWLLIPLGTGVFALIGSWLGSFLGRTTEHKQWLRNEKVETYSKFLMQTREGDFVIQHFLRGAIEGAKAVESGHFTGNHRLHIVAPKAIREAADHHIALRQVISKFVNERPVTGDNPTYLEAVEDLERNRARLLELMAADLGIAK